MTENLVTLAKTIAQAARAKAAEDRKRLETLRVQRLSQGVERVSTLSH